MTENPNALVNINDMLPQISEDEFKKEVSSSSFLPRLQIVDPKSSLAMEDIVNAGAIALVRSKEDADDLTKEIDVLIVGMRWKALDTNGETPLAVYDKESEAFKGIKDKSDIKDSGCMWGPEFLVWVSSIRTYATFFCSSKTSRREATNFFKLLGAAATLKTKLIKTQKYSWYGPQIQACSAPFDIPPVEEIKEQVKKFNNPEVTEEPVTDGDKTDRER